MKCQLSSAVWRVPEPESANSPTPGHQRADAESVGCLHFQDLRGQKEMSGWTKFNFNTLITEIPNHRK